MTYRSLSLSRSPSLPIHRPNHSFLPLPDHGISPHTSHTPQLTTAAHHTSTAHSCVILHDFRLISLDYTAQSYSPPTASRSFQCLFYTTDHSNEQLTRHTRATHIYQIIHCAYHTHLRLRGVYSGASRRETTNIYCVLCFYTETSRVRVGARWGEWRSRRQQTRQLRPLIQ